MAEIGEITEQDINPKLPALPRYIENVVEFEAPENSMIVRLPRYYGTTNCMHTDMMGTLVRSLDSMKPEIRGKFLIQGRAMNSATWRKFRSNTAYEFFYNSRYYRKTVDNKREVIQILVPKNIKLTDSQVRDYCKLEFTPESLSQEYGFRAGWYPANFMMDRVNDEESFNSLAPFLGAVNQFKIGTNELKPAILRMVSLKLMMGFEEATVSVSHSVTSRLSQKTIDSVSKVVEIEI
jgi:hypothetical protein